MWRDQYRTEDGMERRMKRVIEQENKRERSAAKREYNETVRVRHGSELSLSLLTPLFAVTEAFSNSCLSESRLVYSPT